MSVFRAISLLSTPDHLLLRRIHHWYPPRWFRAWMLLSTRAGDGWLWLAVAFVLLLVGSEESMAALLSGAAAVIGGIALFWLLKRCVGRKRPCHIEAHCWASLLPPDRFSFPSGHTITAFAVLASVGSCFPAALPLLLLSACSVAASRLFLGMHFFTDVIAGMLIGSGLGLLSYSLISAGCGFRCGV